MVLAKGGAPQVETRGSRYLENVRRHTSCKWTMESLWKPCEPNLGDTGARVEHREEKPSKSHNPRGCPPFPLTRGTKKTLQGVTDPLSRLIFGTGEWLAIHLKKSERSPGNDREDDTCAFWNFSFDDFYLGWYEWNGENTIVFTYFKYIYI